MANVVALVDDLFFQAKMAETARRVGVALKTVTTGEAFLAEALGPFTARPGPAKGEIGASVHGEPPALSEVEGSAAGGQQSPPALLIVDLNARHGAIEALEQLRVAGNQCPVVAFLSHVQVELAERARAAGCRQVMPRSKFTQDLAAILSAAKS